MQSNPYAPSPSTLKDASQGALEQGASGFRDLGGITRILSMLLLVGAGCEALSLVSSLMQLNLLEHAPYSKALADANDERERVVHGAQFILYLVTMVFFARWIYLAHKNLPELGARLLHFTPGWAVGSLFIPILSWWLPYRAMRDLAKASRNPWRWDLEDTPTVIVIWWILWLLVEFAGSGALQVSSRDRTLRGFENLTLYQCVSSVLSVPLYLLARYIVRRVWRDQSDTFTRSGAG